jgi:hypothetical protein
MDLRTRATVSVPLAPHVAFDRAVDAAFMPKIMLRFGPIPAIVAVEPIPGGTHRKVSMSDGSDIEEEVTVIERPQRYGYRWVTPPKPPFGWLVRGGEAEWTFTPAGQGTSISWSYRFTLTSPFAVAAAWPLIQVFRGWMAQALTNLGRQPATGSSS